MADPSHGLNALEIGGGRVASNEIIHLELPQVSTGYANAQLDDHRQLSRSRFPWRPPLTLALEARTSQDEPPGTLGFGFWNDPFSLGQAGASRKLPAVPNALWFFYASPPNDLSLAKGAPPTGWKASSVRTPPLPPLLLGPPALLAFGLSYLPLMRRLIVGTAKSFISASEVGLDIRLDEWHSYRIDWSVESAAFHVDGEEVLRANEPPRGPLGFIAWIDNQYAVFAPSKGIRFGVLTTSEPQSLSIRNLSLDRPG